MNVWLEISATNPRDVAEDDDPNYALGSSDHERPFKYVVRCISFMTHAAVPCIY